MHVSANWTGQSFEPIVFEMLSNGLAIPVRNTCDIMLRVYSTNPILITHF
jgi:hypothetical protein